MEKFMKMMEKDFQKEDFTKKEMVVYGIIVPMVLIAIMAFAGWLESL
jgi:cobalamin biosynthesis protein CobD/CbiB